MNLYLNRGTEMMMGNSLLRKVVPLHQDTDFAAVEEFDDGSHVIDQVKWDEWHRAVCENQQIRARLRQLDQDRFHIVNRLEIIEQTLGNSNPPYDKICEKLVSAHQKGPSLDRALGMFKESLFRDFEQIGTKLFDASLTTAFEKSSELSGLTEDIIKEAVSTVKAKLFVTMHLKSSTGSVTKIDLTTQKITQGYPMPTIVSVDDLKDRYAVTDKMYGELACENWKKLTYSVNQEVDQGSYRCLQGTFFKVELKILETCNEEDLAAFLSAVCIKESLYDRSSNEIIINNNEFLHHLFQAFKIVQSVYQHQSLEEMPIASLCQELRSRDAFSSIKEPNLKGILLTALIKQKVDECLRGHQADGGDFCIIEHNQVNYICVYSSSKAVSEADVHQAIVEQNKGQASLKTPLELKLEAFRDCDSSNQEGITKAKSIAREIHDLQNPSLQFLSVCTVSEFLRGYTGSVQDIVSNLDLVKRQILEQESTAYNPPRRVQADYLSLTHDQGLYGDLDWEQPT